MLEKHIPLNDQKRSSSDEISTTSSRPQALPGPHSPVTHTRKLTWNLKMDPSSRRFLLESTMFMIYVKFLGSKWSYNHQTFQVPKMDESENLDKLYGYRLCQGIPPKTVSQGTVPPESFGDITDMTPRVTTPVTHA